MDTEYFVSDGLGGSWGTYTRRATGSLRRIVSKSLPLRQSREEAEEDLRKWLAKNQKRLEKKRQNQDAITDAETAFHEFQRESGARL